MKTFRLTAVALATLTLLASCMAATDAKKDSTKSTVYQISFDYSMDDDTAVKHPGLSFQLIPASGKSITEVTLTYAVNAAALDGGLDGATWNSSYGDEWTKEWSDENDSIEAANNWRTYSYSPATDADQDVYLTLWSTWATWGDIARGRVYIKSLSVTYSDSSTETVAWDSSWNEDGANADRVSLWTQASGTDGMSGVAGAVGTVSF